MGPSKAERKERQRAFLEIDTLYFEQQAALVRDIADPDGPRFVCALMSRQTGKSHGAEAGLELLALQPSSKDCAIIVLTSTVDRIKRMAFEPARRMVRDFCLPARATERPAVISFSNGSKIYYLGVDDEATIKSLRGTPNLIAVLVEEAGVYKSDVLREVIETAVAGLRPRAGKLVIVGTPSLEGAQGVWFGITQSPKYAQHRALYLHNTKVPSFARVEQLIDDELETLFPHLPPEARRKTAYFRREYGCEFVVDLEERVYQLTEANLVDAIPDNLRNHATGADLGKGRNNAVVTAGWDDDKSTVFVTDQELVEASDALAFGIAIDANDAKRHPMFITADGGGLGIVTINTVKRLYPHLPIDAAIKPEIAIQVRTLNMLLANGRLKLLKGSPLALELARPTWVNGIIGGDIDEHGHHSHLVPALRYLAIKLIDLLPIITPVAAVDTTSNEYVNRQARAGLQRYKELTAGYRPDGVGEDYVPEGDTYDPFAA